VTGRPYEGQGAIVTGAASGIGRAIARRLADGGASIAVVDRDLAGAEATAAAIQEAGGEALAIEADVSRAADVKAAVEAAVRLFGSPAILVNDAGIARMGRIDRLSEEDWDLSMAVNLRSCYLFARETIPLMVDRRYGRIISISSGTAIRVGPGTGAYAASKAGIIALTKAIAGEVARMGITANVVAPGVTDTAMTRAQFGGQAQLIEQATTGGIANPMRVVIQPEDIAAAVAFFALPESRYVTGQTLHVNAGSLMP
jgi:3-oxoacyl-[acyl-carrier protein] reductase